jgi:alkanesulfonate monooxygenase
VGEVITVAHTKGGAGKTSLTFNLAYAVTPESFEDFVEFVVPELQRRGVYKRDYRPGTLREKLFGAGRARLGSPHPAVRHRRMR